MDLRRIKEEFRPTSRLTTEDKTTILIMLQNFSTKEPIMVFATSKCIGGTVSGSLPTIPLLVHSLHNLDFCEKLKYTYPQFHKLMPLTTKATAINSHKIRTQNRN
jgi:hypothetical protein